MQNNIEKKILIIDAQPVCRAGVVRVLSDRPHLKIASEASSLEEALAVSPTDIDLVVVDLACAKSRGISALRDLKARFRAAYMLVLTSHDERLFAERCLKAGASGYLMKNAAPADIACAVERVAEGQLHVSENLKTLMIGRLSNPKQDGGDFDRLSDKELLIIQHIGLSKNNKEIARELQISVKTIESHRSRIKAKLRLDSPQELLRYAMRLSGDSGF